MAGEGALTLAKGRRKIAIVLDVNRPGIWQNVTDISNWIDATCGIARNDFSLGFAASDTVDDPALCAVSNRPALDADNFAAAFDVYRYLVDSDGSFGTDDTLWAVFKNKGTAIWIVEREEPIPLASVPWTSGDKFVAFPFVTDNPLWPSNLDGYLKRHVEPQPNGDVIHGVIGDIDESSSSSGS